MAGLTTDGFDVDADAAIPHFIVPYPAPHRELAVISKLDQQKKLMYAVCVVEMVHHVLSLFISGKYHPCLYVP